MPTQSIDLSTVTDTTFGGSLVESILLNGLSIWVKPASWNPLNCNGIFQWSVQNATTAQTGMGLTSATQGNYIAVGENSYNGTANGRTHIYNTNGTLLRHINTPNYPVSNGADGWFGSVIGIEDNYVYLFSYFFIYKYDMDTGQEIWHSLCGDDVYGGWYVTESDDYLVAIITNRNAPQVGKIRFFDKVTGAYSHQITVSLNAQEFLYRLAISKDSTRIVVTFAGGVAPNTKRVKFINATTGATHGATLGGDLFLGWTPHWNEKHQFFTFPSAGNDTSTYIYSKDGVHIRTINMAGAYNIYTSTSGDYIYISDIDVPAEKVFAYNYVTNSIAFTLNSTHVQCRWGSSLSISESGRLVVTSTMTAQPYDLNFIDVYT